MVHAARSRALHLARSSHGGDSGSAADDRGDGAGSVDAHNPGADSAPSDAPADVTPSIDSAPNDSASNDSSSIDAGVIPSGLVARWTLDDGSGSIAREQGGSGKDANLIGAATWTTGRRGGALSLDGKGIDTRIRGLAEQQIGKTGNVYAELGSTWREVMKDPEQAAHVLGKLLKFLGEDRILWGTDAIWYGSPQDQIQAFRAFEITPEFQERYGYPALTPEIKRKIFGLNAARVYGVDVDEIRRAHRQDAVNRQRTEYQNDPRPSFRTYGPRTRRELLALLRTHPV